MCHGKCLPRTSPTWKRFFLAQWLYDSVPLPDGSVHPLASPMLYTTGMDDAGSGTGVEHHSHIPDRRPEPDGHDVVACAEGDATLGRQGYVLRRGAGLVEHGYANAVAAILRCMESTLAWSCSRSSITASASPTTFPSSSRRLLSLHHPRPPRICFIPKHCAADSTARGP
jgi:hypothetical protein